jgi:hypothetical protein
MSPEVTHALHDRHHETQIAQDEKHDHNHEGHICTAECNHHEANELAASLLDDLPTDDVHSPLEIPAIKEQSPSSEIHEPTNHTHENHKPGCACANCGEANELAASLLDDLVEDDMAKTQQTEQSSKIAHSNIEDLSKQTLRNNPPEESSHTAGSTHIEQQNIRDHIAQEVVAAENTRESASQGGVSEPDEKDKTQNSSLSKESGFVKPGQPEKTTTTTPRNQTELDQITQPNLEKDTLNQNPKTIHDQTKADIPQSETKTEQLQTTSQVEDTDPALFMPETMPLPSSHIHSNDIHEELNIQPMPNESIVTHRSDLELTTTEDNILDEIDAAADYEDRETSQIDATISEILSSPQETFQSVPLPAKEDPPLLSREYSAEDLQQTQNDANGLDAHAEGMLETPLAAVSLLEGKDDQASKNPIDEIITAKPKEIIDTKKLEIVIEELLTSQMAHTTKPNSIDNDFSSVTAINSPNTDKLEKVHLANTETIHSLLQKYGLAPTEETILQLQHALATGNNEKLYQLLSSLYLLRSKIELSEFSSPQQQSTTQNNGQDNSLLDRCANLLRRLRLTMQESSPNALLVLAD